VLEQLQLLPDSYNVYLQNAKVGLEVGKMAENIEEKNVSFNVKYYFPDQLITMKIDKLVLDLQTGFLYR
jgi:hypothetical protein